jgi:hypothetical protein
MVVIAEAAALDPAILGTIKHDTRVVFQQAKSSGVPITLIVVDGHSVSAVLAAILDV